VDLTDADMESLSEQARRIVDANKYLTLSTADTDGLPWVTPVYFTPDGDRYLWLSSPAARHSRNIAERPEVAFTIFDSTVPFGGAEAVYCAARAGLVPDEELEQAAAVFAARFDELADYTADEMREPAELRLYQAVVTETSVLLRGGDPRNTNGIDTRVVVT
jgi:nitroimidazol reductase NimA-like FMN-containing flavoprotein (pyridoxamine 5'-phosphate oxidase superfamily)